ncbi:hypothetical protein TNCV_4272371 [Trichonephila clavipes]|nr:hypothetical protein TNCV_4272371 [Trichonephila clavipes]
MAAIDFLHHENPLTWPGVEPATLGTEGQPQTNYASQPGIYASVKGMWRGLAAGTPRRRSARQTFSESEVRSLVHLEIFASTPKRERRFKTILMKAVADDNTPTEVRGGEWLIEQPFRRVSLIRVLKQRYRKKGSTKSRLKSLRLWTNDHEAEENPPCQQSPFHLL